MSARVAPAAAVLLVLSLAVAAWAVRTETGEVFNVPFSPWSALYSIGSGDPGTVLIDGGTTVSEQAIAVGGLPGGDGTLTVTGAGSRLDIDGDPEDRSPNLSCGNDGACLIEVLDGGVISVNGAGSEVGDAFPAGLQAGFGPEAVGSIRVSGPGSSVFVENGAANTLAS